ncbi:MAG: hypothetical protein EOP11_06860 [Proteobacteria bacterium]|nr:MAG: hypothetical protein EOP11_06860 [Pseudomonadota bacterium]
MRRALNAKAFLFALSSFIAAGPARAENVRAIMQAPLIVGASVSADYKTASPGRRLALRHTAASNLETIARPGQNSKAILPLVDAVALRGRTSVIALDLFFWDSVLSDAGRSVENIKRLVQLSADAKIPLVLGEVPELIAGRQVSRKKLNAEITRLCKAPHGCYLVPLSGLFEKIRADGGLTIEGRLVPVAELLPDGLHLSAVAAEYIADGMSEILEK